VVSKLRIYIAKDAKQLDEQWCLDCMDDVFFAAEGGLFSEKRSNDGVWRWLEKVPKPPPSEMATPA
jgi:hypothetical protein